MTFLKSELPVMGFAGRRGWGVLAAWPLLALTVPAVAAAEPYAALFAGAAFTENSDLKEKLDLGALSVADGTLKDLRVDTAAVYGGKLGYFFEPRVLGGNVGLELEAYHFKSDVDAQTARVSGTILGAPFNGDVRVASSDIEVTTVALNALYRSPLDTSPDFPRGRFQPYVGAGLGAEPRAHIGLETAARKVRARVQRVAVEGIEGDGRHFDVRARDADVAVERSAQYRARDPRRLRVHVGLEVIGLKL